MTGSTLLLYISVAIVVQITLIGAASVLRSRTAVKTDGVSSPAIAVSASPAAWVGWREFRVTHRAYEDLNESQCSFYFQPVDGAPLLAFKPGQFLTFQLQAGGADAGQHGKTQTVIRCYSLSDRPASDHYRITVKRLPAPLKLPGVAPGLASNLFHNTVQTGDILRLRAPSGAFFVDPDPTHDMVLIAGGIGITPMLSMLLWCVDEQPQRRIHLYYGLHSSREHIFKSQLAQLAATHPRFRLTVVYSQPTPHDVPGQDFQHCGHVDLDLLKSTLSHGHHQFYICGPAPMMESLVPALAAWGVLPADIHFEAFGPASIRTVNNGTEGSQHAAQGVAVQPLEVQFLKTGRTFVWTATSGTLLDFAEKNGISVESGCRAGSCGACETKLISGSIRYADKPDYDIATGNCLLCVGVPSADVVLAA